MAALRTTCRRSLAATPTWTSSDIEVVEFTPPPPPGDTTSIPVDLPAGSYVLICNLVHHYSLGMYAGFIVA